MALGQAFTDAIFNLFFCKKGSILLGKYLRIQYNFLQKS